MYYTNESVFMWRCTLFVAFCSIASTWPYEMEGNETERKENINKVAKNKHLHSLQKKKWKRNKIKFARARNYRVFFSYENKNIYILYIWNKCGMMSKEKKRKFVKINQIKSSIEVKFSLQINIYANGTKFRKTLFFVIDEWKQIIILFGIWKRQQQRLLKEKWKKRILLTWANKVSE